MEEIGDTTIEHFGVNSVENMSNIEATVEEVNDAVDTTNMMVFT